LAYSERLLVRCAGVLCGLEVPMVREVIRPLPLAELPRMAPFVMGAVSHRGEAFPVVDLAGLLSLGSCEAMPSARLVVVQLPRGRLGVLVEKVEGVSDQVEARDIDLTAALESALPAEPK
jgi:chemotaxis signal transduction protein